jgi:hypothetical protein
VTSISLPPCPAKLEYWVDVASVKPAVWALAASRVAASASPPLSGSLRIGEILRQRFAHQILQHHQRPLGRGMPVCQISQSGVKVAVSKVQDPAVGWPAAFTGPR